MKRVILLAVLIAVTDLVFVSAAWAPTRGMRATAGPTATITAPAAPTAVGGDVAVLQYSCDQIQAVVNTQVQSGQGTGAVAGAAQALGVDQQQVLACFGRAVALQDSTVSIGGGGATVKAAKKMHTAKAVKKASPTAKATASPTATATATAAAALPPTGGASAVALGAAGLLVAGGLLARRIVR